jgi:starch phosphorylase
VNEAWPNVRFIECSIGPDRVFTGSPIPLRAEVDLAGLTPDDLRVEALVGRVGSGGELEDVQVLTLEAREQHGYAHVFGRDIMPYATGRLGFAVRVGPNHFSDPLHRPCNSLLKWAADMPKGVEGS